MTVVSGRFDAHGSHVWLMSVMKAAVEGRLPRGINIERLRDPHADWSRQFEELGLDPD
jgi:hypothetical protein